MVPEPSAGLHMFEIFGIRDNFVEKCHAEQIPSRAGMSPDYKQQYVRSIRDTEISVQPITLIFGASISRGMSKRSISFRSPTAVFGCVSREIRYEVHLIRRTKSKYYDERPKLLISQLNLSFLGVLFLYVTGIALVYRYTLPEALLFSTLFSLIFFAEMPTEVFLKR